MEPPAWNWRSTIDASSHQNNNNNKSQRNDYYYRSSSYESRCNNNNNNNNNIPPPLPTRRHSTGEFVSNIVAIPTPRRYSCQWDSTNNDNNKDIAAVSRLPPVRRYRESKMNHDNNISLYPSDNRPQLPWLPIESPDSNNCNNDSSKMFPLSRR